MQVFRETNWIFSLHRSYIIVNIVAHVLPFAHAYSNCMKVQWKSGCNKSRCAWSRKRIRRQCRNFLVWILSLNVKHLNSHSVTYNLLGFIFENRKKKYAHEWKILDGDAYFSTIITRHDSSSSLNTWCTFIHSTDCVVLINPVQNRKLNYNHTRNDFNAC